MPRIALGISYDGRPWQGWQTQPHRITVQDALEDALSRFVAAPVQTVCAGRTDTGVHATAQVVHLDCAVQRSDESWIRGVNAHLPQSIAVQWAQEVSTGFHARFSARARAYTYVILNSRVRQPLWSGRAGWIFQQLDARAMQQGAQHLLGEHDFSSFRSSQCQASSPVRTVVRADIEQRGDLVLFHVRANAFLHHMVRNIVGALVQVGLGRQGVDYLATLIDARDRTRGAPTFAPDGLYLTDVVYPDFELPGVETGGFGLN
jgi:tRNA pseudouridine38-40 synthase